MYKNLKKYIFVFLLFTSAAEAADVNVRSFGALPNDNNEDSSAIQRAINSLKSGDRLVLPAGQYLIKQTLDFENLSNITMDGQNQATLKKSGNIEYLMRIYYSNSVTVKGLTFIGNTANQILWGEQGLLLASCKNSSVLNNTFRNFGDAAVRAHTATDDIKAINSENIRIANNSFYNITQVTTTQAVGGSHGGTKNIIIENNTFEGLRGSIKCASRKPVNLCFIRGNHIKSSLRNAVEIASFSDVTVENNIFENISNFVMNIYGNEEMYSGYQWGNINIQNNIFRNANSGIRIANTGYGNGSQFDLNNIRVVNNIFDNLGAGYASGAIGLTNNTNKKMNNVVVNNNFFRNIKASSYVGLSSGVYLSANNNLAWPLQFKDEPYVKAGSGSFPSDVRSSGEN
ncbi:MAG: glycosyl hydrolase family 28-related protein, partial [Pseudobdellovibrionaceae bacterium]